MVASAEAARAGMVDSAPAAVQRFLQAALSRSITAAPSVVVAAAGAVEAARSARSAAVVAEARAALPALGPQGGSRDRCSLGGLAERGLLAAEEGLITPPDLAAQAADWGRQVKVAPRGHGMTGKPEATAPADRAAAHPPPSSETVTSHSRTRGQSSARGPDK